MRWLTLPMSIAVHGAALLLFLVVPLAVDIDLPTPWTARAAGYVAAGAVAPPDVERPRPVAPDVTAVPLKAPDRIEHSDEYRDAGGTSDITDRGPGTGPPVVGIPDGLIDGVIPVPVAPVAPVVDPAQPRRVGGAIRAPRKLVHVPAQYPEMARQLKIEGYVILEATIDERGSVIGARVLKSVPLLDAAALAALKQWRYTPTLLNGVPVPVIMTVTFNFKLDTVP